jgi:O-antigen ligase
MTRRARLHHEIFVILCMMLAFFMPFTVRVLPPIIGLIVLNWLAEPGYLERLKALFSDRSRLLTLALGSVWVYYLAGMIYTERTQTGWFDLEVKLSLIVFPLVLSTSLASGITRKELDRILVMFIAGTVTGALLFFGHSAYLSLTTPTENPFHYEHLSWYMHTTYLSMYACFALAALACIGIRKFRTLDKVQVAMMAAAAMLLFLFIVMLSSRAGTLMLTIFIMSLSLFLVFSLKRPWTGWGLLTGFIAAIVLLFLFFPNLTGRFSGPKTGNVPVQEISAGNVAQKTSNAAGIRIDLWKSALAVIRENPVAGVGTGDGKAALVEEYRKEGIKKAYLKRFNSHEQYLQTAISIGIPGLLVLLLSLVIPAVFALRKGLYLYFMFLLVIGFNMLFESLLEAQAGTIFYGFFNTLLFWYGIQRSQE